MDSADVRLPRDLCREQDCPHLAHKREPDADNGVWLCTTEAHHESLRREFPNMRSVQVFRKK